MAISDRVNAAALERDLEEERQRFDVPGMAVAVIKDGELALTRGFGLRDVERGLPVTERTLFAIGSSTKAFTATLIAAMVGDGLLEWDRPVREYLPGFRLHDQVASELMTPRDLLCHRSGLPRHDLCWYANPFLSRREMVEQRLRHMMPNKTFRQLWQYNNLMFLTAGYLAGEVAGASWEEGVRRRLLDPLGMTTTCFSPPEARETGDWSRGYGETGGVVRELEQKDFPVCGPAGSLYSCVVELAEWVKVNVNRGRRGDHEVIAPMALQEVQVPAMVMPAGDGMWPERFGIGYGLGWFLESYRGRRIVHHGGAIDGYSAMVMFDPEARAGVAVLTNRTSSLLREAAAYRVMDELLGLETLPWGERLRGVELAVREGGQKAAQHRAANARNAPPGHPAEAYAGEYHHPGYGSVIVSVSGDGLAARYGALEMTTEHRHHETWDLWLGKLLETPIPLTFTTDDEGEVVSLSVPFEPMVDPIRFVRRPPAELSDPERLDALTGEYAMGPIEATVRLQAGKLVGLQTFTLLPYAETTFRVAGQPSLSVEFVLVDGRVKEVVVEPGVGVLTPRGLAR